MGVSLAKLLLVAQDFEIIEVIIFTLLQELLGTPMVAMLRYMILKFIRMMK
jgi:hypothetical protein